MLTIVIPTYNEKNNLPILIKKIFDLRISDLSVCVVDDNSPDGTGEVAEELVKTYPIQVIHREKKLGLGAAYACAFASILRTSQVLRIMEMDADLSHDPAMIPKFLEKAADCDVVLGSRYTAGGRIENWNFFRRLISRWGNYYARTVLELPYRDLTGGYKLYKREVLENIDLDSLSSLGYNFQIETTYKAHLKGYKICEIPITFTERKIGESKFNLKIILESFWKVLALRFKQFSSSRK